MRTFILIGLWLLGSLVKAQTSSVVEVNGTKLYYEMAGEGQPVVLIHGFSLDSRMWDLQWAALSKRFKVIRYDVRGFGQSQRAQDTHSPADDLKALLDYLKIEKAHLVGLSMGANIALNFATKYPDKVNKIVAADPNIDGFINYTPELGAVFGQIIGMCAQDGWHLEEQEVWRRSPLMRLYTADDKTLINLNEIIADYNGDHFINPRLNPTYGTPTTLELLPTLKTPVLVLIGEKDEESIQRVANLLVEKIPQVQKKVIKGAGHLSNMDKPRDFNKAVTGFLK
ncbi:MAG: alpha/beta fold hydrolase [Runella sp.]